MGGVVLPQEAAHRTERKKLKRECHDEGDRISEAAGQRKETASSTVACSATTVDKSSPGSGERPSSEQSHFENERVYLPALGSRTEVGPTLVGSHPGPASRHVPGSRTVHTRMLAEVGSMVLALALALRTPCLCRCILRLRPCCAACLFRDLSSY